MRIILAGLTTAAIFVNIAPTLAADIADPSACTVMGIVSAGAGADKQTYTEDPDSAKYDWWQGTGEGALGWTCGNWNFQADVALNRFTGTDIVGPDTGHFTQRQSHIGGAIFARVPETGALGISASYIDDSARVDVDTSPTDFTLSKKGAVLRFGGFGEYYVNDQFTVGTSLHYITGETPVLTVADNLDVSGFEASVLAKFYVNSNLALNARADLFKGNYEVVAGQVDYTAFAVSLEGEYGLSNSNLSLYGGARLAKRQFELATFIPTIVDDTQVYAGIKYSFGSGTSSLAERDRTGTYDNTSTFAEKLPSFGTSLVRGSSLIAP